MQNDDYQLSFPAIRGIQAGREYYSAMCPLHVAVDLIKIHEDDDSIPPELRAQRVLNKARIPALTDYIVENPKSYAFSSLTVSIDSSVEFMPHGTEGLASKVGILKVPFGVTYLINDGQHRRAAIERALQEKPELRNESISLVIYIDRGLERSQQLFSDLNRYVVRPTPSISILYDHRDPMSRLALEITDKVPVFLALTEKAKTTISNRSRKLFTLSILYQSTCDLLGRKKGQTPTIEERELAIRYWQEVSVNIKDWQMAARREVAPADLRRETIHAHGITLRALGRLGSFLSHLPAKDWKPMLKKLSTIDWDRSNTKLWSGRAINSTGRITKSHNNTILTCNLLKKAIGMPLTPDEESAEREFNQ
jgi:DNA sulfur modification protein DndB